MEDMICNKKRPVIVGVTLHPKDIEGTTRAILIPGHYVLVVGKEGDDFTIHDPTYGENGEEPTKLSYYEQTTDQSWIPGFETRGYVDFTDPSPIQELSGQSVSLAAEGDIDSSITFSVAAEVGGAVLRVVDPEGNVTGVDSQLVEEIPNSAYFVDSVENDETGDPPDSEVDHVAISTPADGLYTVEVQGLKLSGYNLYIDAFAIDGTSQPPVVISGVAGFDSVSTFDIDYDPFSVEPPTAVRLATFEITADDIMNGLLLDMMVLQEV